MDNLTLDELGILSLRQGSAKINSTAFADTDVHSLSTHTLSGTRYRMAGCTSAVYANGTSIASSVAGSGDIHFGAHMGQMLFARSTTKKKYDGTTVRNWGIAAPSTAPALTGIAADSATFATCASTESPIMTANEGSVAFQPDKAGTANASVELTPDTTTARATATKTFASPTNFTVYNAGQAGTDDDLIDFYAYVTEPQYLDRIVIMFDVNDGTFQEDYYVYEFKNGEPIEVALNVEEFLDADYEVEGIERELFRSRIERRVIESEFRIDKPVSNTGWNHFAVPRGKLTRVGSTTGQDWTTVKAVRISFVGLAGGSGAAVRFDEIKIIGGAERALTGAYKAVVVAVRNDGTYQALSGPSALSAEIHVKAQGIRATISAPTISALDTQVNELWLYLFGGNMNGFYRAKVLTGGPFSGAQTIDVTISDRAMLAANLRLETDNTTPPDSIIAIEGPHYDRTLCLTATHIYPSRRINPDSFSEGEVVRVGDATETALWIKKLREGGLFVGTTRDIYRLDGDWTPLPDGTINVAKRGLGVTRAPISSAVATGTIDGVETLVYLTADGWTALGGRLLTDGAVDLLWRGQTRHGVSPVNITGTSARFRAAISKNVLFCLTPEGSSTTSSDILHVYHFGKQKWYRFDYPQAFRSLYAEPDGTLIAGDASGFVRTLDSATKQDDGTDIPVVLWTPAEGDLLTVKDPLGLVLQLDTDEDTATVAFHLDGRSTAGSSVTTAQATEDIGTLNLSEVDEFRHVQMRITGSFSTFNFRGYSLKYLDRPLPHLIHDTGFIDLSDVFAFVRRIRVKARTPVNLTVAPYWDGTAATSRTITSRGNTDQIYEVPLGRDDKGATARALITSSVPSHIYWVEFEYNESGKTKQKRISMNSTV